MVGGAVLSRQGTGPRSGLSIHSTFDFMVDSTHDFRFTAAADPRACMDVRLFGTVALAAIVIAVGTAIKAHAQRQHFCSNATLRADYAIRATGSVVSGQVFAPVAFVRLFSYDGKGQLAGNLTLRLTDLVNAQRLLPLRI
jgi:hypothetical protein